MLYRINISNGNREPLVKWILQQKANGIFTVVDVGGSLSGWTSDFVDAICDINPPEKDMSNRPVMIFKMNINDPYAWEEINNYVKNNGKFDFSICTHTLEDISNPKFVCKKLEEISKAGYIAVPSKYIELARFEDEQYKYRGYIHHRWIFSIENNKFIGYPKIPLLEHDTIYDSIASTNIETRDLSFYWQNSIPIQLINNDFLGPSGSAVIGYYRQLLKDDLDKLQGTNQNLLKWYYNRHMPNNHIQYLQGLKNKGFEPKVVYDIGACVTEWTDAVKQVWPNARCILFEAFDKLENVLKMSGHEYYINVLSDMDNKIIKFYQNDTMITGNSYYREVGCSINYYPEDLFVERQTIRLDTLVKQHGIPLPDLVKIDVQGAEKDVLDGGWQTINNAQHLIVEMQHSEYNKGAPKVDETKPWIELHGWNCIAPLFTNNGPDGDYGFEKQR
jgi:FkbM family methyltransferase